MKHLNERIMVDVSGFTATESKTYVYKVYRISDMSSPIFIGNTFLKQGDTNKTFDITEICQNYAFLNKYLTLENRTQDGASKADVYETFKIELDVDGQYNGETETVLLTYQYPHHMTHLDMYDNYVMNAQGLKPVYPDMSSNAFGISNTISYHDETLISSQIIKRWKGKLYSADVNIANDAETSFYTALNSLKVVNPIRTRYENWDTEGTKMTMGEYGKYPYVRQGQNGQYFSVSCLVNGQYTQLDLIHANELSKPHKKTYIIPSGSTLITFASQQYEHSEAFLSYPKHDHAIILSFTYELTDYVNDDIFISMILIKEINSDAADGIYWEGNAWLGDGVYDFNSELIADVCDNLDAYYLQWQDRNGGTQSQHFALNNTVSIGYDTLTITNYYDQKHLSHIKSTLQFEINSEWINEKQLPNYESIFVSPHLVLFDVKNNRSYQVVLKDKEFIEKTYRNQGNRLFNLKLKLEEAQDQNIVY